MGKVSVSKSMKWIGIGLILVVGLIHLVDAPDSSSETLYKGLLFTANGVGAVIAAAGIFLDRRDLGWTLGAIVAGGAFTGYVISRTVGLPGLGVDVWLESLGILSLIVEGLYLLTYLRAVAAPSRELAGDEAG